MCQCCCQCATQAPPWWVTMGFVPPLNPGQVHTATPVGGTVVTAPPPAQTPPVRGGGTTGGAGGIGGAIGGLLGTAINDITNPLGSIISLL